MRKFLVLSLVIVFAAGCRKEPPPNPPAVAPQNSTPQARIYTYEIVNTYHHDPDAFTQGLEFYNGELYESTGLKGRSSLRRVDLSTGKVLQKIDIPKEYFAEGMTIFGDNIYQLTYQEHVGFIYDRKTFQKLGEWHYEGEGWGLTHDSTNLIMSNGSNKINFIDPKTLTIVRTIEVTDEGMLLENINELEYIHGILYANVWQNENNIFMIDPVSGKVIGRIDQLNNLLSPMERTEKVDVLNGIAYDNKVSGTAYDSTNIRLFVTGKLWPKLFEIRLKKKEQALP